MSDPDLLALQLRLSQGHTVDAVLSVTAAKTGRCQTYPVPSWLRAWLAPEGLPYRRVADFARKLVRKRLASACVAGGVTAWCPKQLRQRSITEWSRANATAGAIVHGSGLGVLGHYVDPVCVLEAASGRLRVPASFEAGSDDGQLERAILRLDSASRAALTAVAVRMAE